jgi:hypothetical protein
MKSSSGISLLSEQATWPRHCRMALTGACSWPWWSGGLRRHVQAGERSQRGDTAAPDLRCHE